VGVDLHQVPEVPDVDAQDGNTRPAHQRHRAQHRAVAAHAEGEVEPLGEAITPERPLVESCPRCILRGDAWRVAAAGQPLDRLAGEAVRLGTGVVGDDGNGRHQPPTSVAWPSSARCLRAWSKNSVFPSAPRSGEVISPIMTAPAATRAEATPSMASRHSAGSRMTPFPFDAAARPTSNCGFTSTTRS